MGLGVGVGMTVARGVEVVVGVGVCGVIGPAAIVGNTIVACSSGAGSRTAVGVAEGKAVGLASKRSVSWAQPLSRSPNVARLMANHQHMGVHQGPTQRARGRRPARLGLVRAGETGAEYATSAHHALILMGAVADSPLHTMVTCPVPGCVVNPMRQVQDTLPSRSVFFGSNPLDLLLVPAGVVYSIVHGVPGSVRTPTLVSSIGRAVWG